MTLDELRRELDGGRVRPAYLLAGSEPLLREDALRAIEAAVLDREAREWNVDRLDGETAAAGELEDALRTLPVLAPRRLVVLREPEARKRKPPLADGLPGAVERLLDPPDTVLVVTAARVDRRSRWVKAFADPAATVACDPPRPGRDLVAFVRAEARRQELVLERGAAEALAERVGPQLLVLRQELAKAALVAGPGAPLTVGHVTDAVGRSAEEPIWDLTDAIGAGRVADALGVLGRMQAAGAPPPVLLGSLASHFRKLARLCGGGRVPGHPFAVKKLEQQARRYTPGRLRGCLRAIHETDLVLKGRSELTPELALERLVLALSD